MMKKLLSVLLAALMLCTGLAMTFGVTASAAPAQKVDASASAFDWIFDTALKLFKGLDPSTMTEKEQENLIEKLSNIPGLKGNELIGKLLKDLDKQYGLPITFKNLLHKHGIYSFPFYERSVIWNFIFKWLLFGWFWMPLVK